MEKLGKSTKKPLVTVWGVAALLIVLALLGSVMLSAPGGVVLMAGKKAKLQNEFNEVQTAVLGYYTEYADYPIAADNATLIKVLIGLSGQGNTRQIAFVIFKPSDLDAKGELLDPWGTPIEMSVTAEGKLHVRSAGPDKVFGTADDVTTDCPLPPAN